MLPSSKAFATIREEDCGVNRFIDCYQNGAREAPRDFQSRVTWRIKHVADSPQLGTLLDSTEYELRTMIRLTRQLLWDRSFSLTTQCSTT